MKKINFSDSILFFIAFAILYAIAFLVIMQPVQRISYSDDNYVVETKDTQDSQPVLEIQSVETDYITDSAGVRFENLIFMFETPKYTDEELDLLYRIAWVEARGESDKGIRLVIHVVLNRVEHRSFPDDISGVIYQPRQFPTRLLSRANPCQRIIDAVHEALEREDETQGALYFRAVRGASGSWHERALTRIFEYGGHRFYK
jgi:spore germination cell wall hydrolase CwlJ-like protein